jgi:hypothetical protein
MKAGKTGKPNQVMCPLGDRKSCLCVYLLWMVLGLVDILSAAKIPARKRLGHKILLVKA